MCHHINGDGNCQDDDIILTGFDLHTIGIGQPEPALGDLSDLAAAIADSVLVVQDIAFHLQIIEPLASSMMQINNGPVNEHYGAII